MIEILPQGSQDFDYNRPTGVYFNPATFNLITVDNGTINTIYIGLGDLHDAIMRGGNESSGNLASRLADLLIQKNIIQSWELDNA